MGLQFDLKKLDKTSYSDLVAESPAVVDKQKPSMKPMLEKLQ